jgi:putative hydrolase of the HAD superfamily
MIKVIIFDADGMVVKGERFSSRFSRDYNVPMEKIRMFFDNEFKDCILGKKDLVEEIKPYLTSWGYQGTVEKILDYWFARDRIIDKSVIEAIEQFKKDGKICILATNQEKHAANFLRKEMGFKKVFDFIVASSDIGYKKPQLEFFEEIFKKLPGINREEILFFDDRPENIEGAKNLGMQAKLYTNIKDLENVT